MVEKIMKMWASFYPVVGNCKWFIGEDTFPEIRDLTVTVGDNAMSIYNPTSNKLLGRPVQLIEGDHIILGIGE